MANQFSNNVIPTCYSDELKTAVGIRNTPEQRITAEKGEQMELS